MLFDFIIVGQGIAGTMLAWHLEKKGARILVIDKPNPFSASNVAAGIINPITGRRFVKTWKADEIIPYAAQAYTEAGKLFNNEFIHPVPVVKLFHSVKEQNDWSVRCASADYAAYIVNEQIIYLDKQKVKNNYGAFEIASTWKVEITSLLSAFRNKWVQENLLIEDEIHFADLNFYSDGVGIKNYRAAKIIFCEGADAVQNTLFNFLPFQLAKGEGLLVRIENFYTDRIINDEIIIAHTGFENIYYVGATHEWNFLDALPSESGKQELETSLRAVLNCSYKIVEQKAAIRPTVKDRRPFVGFHPEYNSIAIFNGMGTKGISLSPFFAHHFTQYLLENKPLKDEVNVQRFR